MRRTLWAGSFFILLGFSCIPFSAWGQTPDLEEKQVPITIIEASGQNIATQNKEPQSQQDSRARQTESRLNILEKLLKKKRNEWEKRARNEHIADIPLLQSRQLALMIDNRLNDRNPDCNSESCLKEELFENRLLDDQLQLLHRKIEKNVKQLCYDSATKMLANSEHAFTPWEVTLYLPLCHKENQIELQAGNISVDSFLDKNQKPDLPYKLSNPESTTSYNQNRLILLQNFESLLDTYLGKENYYTGELNFIKEHPGLRQSVKKDVLQKLGDFILVNNFGYYYNQEPESQQWRSNVQQTLFETDMKFALDWETCISGHIQKYFNLENNHRNMLSRGFIDAWLGSSNIKKLPIDPRLYILPQPVRNSIKDEFMEAFNSKYKSYIMLHNNTLELEAWNKKSIEEVLAYVDSYQKYKIAQSANNLVDAMAINNREIRKNKALYKPIAYQYLRLAYYFDMTKRIRCLQAKHENAATQCEKAFEMSSLEEQLFKIKEKKNNAQLEDKRKIAYRELHNETNLFNLLSDDELDRLSQAYGIDRLLNKKANIIIWIKGGAKALEIALQIAIKTDALKGIFSEIDNELSSEVWKASLDKLENLTIQKTKEFMENKGFYNEFSRLLNDDLKVDFSEKDLAALLKEPKLSLKEESDSQASIQQPILSNLDH